MNKNLNTISSLAELQKYVEAFEGCSLKKNATNTVFGSGNLNADIMLIGEAPGANEDEQGQPFVGRSGQLLGKMLEAIGTSREEVYITNVAYWRPPENRNPTKEELESCRPIVEKHIALVNPRILMFMGNIPTQHMLKTKVGITKLHGEWQSFSCSALTLPILALPMYHPAYLLRNPPAKKPAWEDFKTMREKAEKLGVKFAEIKEFI